LSISNQKSIAHTNSKAISHVGIQQMPLGEMAFLIDSLDFLFQPSEQFRLKELLDGDVQPIADFLDGGYRGGIFSELLTKKVGDDHV
jgi:hypothetical protein